MNAIENTPVPRPSLLPGTGRRPWLAAAALGALTALASGQGTPGEVLYHRKISATAGGLGNVLSDQDNFAVVERISDLDGDGIAELAVGAPGNTGAVWILFLNRDGTVRAKTQVLPPPGVSGEAFGVSIADLGDLGGAPAIAVGALADEGAGAVLDTGSVWVFRLDPSGGVLSSQKIANGSGGFTGTLATGDYFGVAVAPLGDLDSDGLCDLAVGAMLDDTGGGGRGAIYLLFMNSDGTVKASLQKIAHNTGGFGTGLTDSDQFGSGICALGDLGGGELTLAVGARNDFDDGVGSVWILFLDSSEQVLSKTKLNTLSGFPAAAGFFGVTVENLGNLDGAGADELAVGADHENNGAGAIFVFRLSVSGTIVSILGSQKVTEGTGNFTGDLAPCSSCPGPGDLFGRGIAALGDLDQDGRLDAAVGAFFDDDGGIDRGAVWILFSNDGTIDLSNVTRWEGDSGGSQDDWNKNSNWSDSKPTSSVTAIIPAVAVAPVIRSGTSAVCRHLIVEPGASVSLQAASSSLALQQGATLLGPVSGAGSVNFSGAGTLAGSASLSAGAGVTLSGDVSVQGGPLLVGSGTVLTVNQDLTIEAGAELECDGTVLLQSGASGTLAGPGTLDCDGPLTLDLVSVAPPRIEVAGNLDINSASGRFAPVSGRIVFDGALQQMVTQSGGTIPIEFRELELASGSDVVFNTDLTANADTVWNGDGHVLGTSWFKGPVTGDDNTSDMVTDEDVLGEGPVFQYPGRPDPTGMLTLDCSGGMSVNLPGQVHADVQVVGGDTLTINGGSLHIVGDLDIVNATVVSGGDLDLTVQDLTLETAGTLDVQGNRIAILDEPTISGDPTLTVRGDLLVAENGELALTACQAVVESGGTLELSGSSLASAAVLGAEGGGYELVLLDGAILRAQHYEFQEMGLGGIDVRAGVQIAAAPLDLRNGLFDRPRPGGRLLKIARNAPADFLSVRFENSDAALGAFNVERAGAQLVGFTSWSGAFGGPAFDVAGAEPLWGAVLSSALGFDERPNVNVLRWKTLSEFDLLEFRVERAPRPGPFTTLATIPASGPKAYQFRDTSIVPGTGYRYRLIERLGIGVESVVWSFVTDGMPGLPTASVGYSPLVVAPAIVPPASPGGLQAALSALGGASASSVHTLRIEPGVHPAFRVEGSFLPSLRLVPAGAGEVVIDTSLEPVRITGLRAGQSLELAGLRLDPGSSNHPALIVEDCRGTLLLDRITVLGRGGALVSASSGVVIQDSGIGELQLERGSSSALTSGEIGGALLTGGAWLESWGSVGRIDRDPSSTWIQHGGSRPDLEVTRKGAAEYEASLRAGSGDLWWLLVSPRLACDRTRGMGMPFLLERRALVGLGGPRSTGAGGTDVRADRLPAELLGAPLYFQALIQRSSGRGFELSDVVSADASR